MMMPFDLVSNIGGILGLFVGMSILSMCEVVQFVVELFALMVFGQNRKKENKTDPMWQHHKLFKRVSLKSKNVYHAHFHTKWYVSRNWRF